MLEKLNVGTRLSSLPQLRANALIKRGSMYMQQQQPLQSTQDFNMAADIDSRNPDVYHHRGQVGRSQVATFLFLPPILLFSLSSKLCATFLAERVVC